MPVAYCPGCHREIPISPADEGLTIECAVCDVRFPAYAAASPAPAARKHSALGVASFVIAVVVGGLDLALAAAIFPHAARDVRAGLNPQDALGDAGALLACLNCASLPFCLAGVAMSLVAVSGGRSRRQLFSWMGLVVNAGVVLWLVVYFALGNMHG